MFTACTVMAKIVGNPEIFPEKYFSQKSTALTRPATCLFPVCVLEQNKKSREKIKSEKWALI